MSQHPRAKEMGITAKKAEFKFDEQSRDWRIDCGIDFIASVYPNVDEMAPEAEIMADAINTINQTGRTPSELVGLIKELRKITERELKYPSYDNDLTLRILEKTKDMA